MKPKPPASSPLASSIPVHCAHLRLADVTSLIPNPRNPNKHGDTQVALLAKIIRHQGWRAPITISKRSGFIVTGHGRLEAARLLQVAEVPVDEQDFATEADEWAHLIADNRIAELADADRAMLRDLAEELDTGDFDMGLTGFDYTALEELMTAAPPPPPDGGSNTTHGMTLDDKLDRFLNSGIAQLVLAFDKETFAEVVQILETARAHYTAETNSDAALQIFKQWKP
jgi:hypothetical protein